MMTDNDIIKALECCSHEYSWQKECFDCEYAMFEGQCGNELIKGALDLINRQKAENGNLFITNADLVVHNKQLKAENERMKRDSVAFDNFARELCKERMFNGNRVTTFKELQAYIRKQKAEAIKEFVAQLDKKAMCGTTCSGCVGVVEWSDVVDVMKEMVGGIASERKYIAISIKHTGEKWKPGKPCVLWGYKRTRDNEKRCFAGYTECLENAELYAVDDMYNHGYAEDIVKREPVKMCADLCRKYRQYDTVLMMESDYRKYCEVFGLVGDKS